MRRLALVFVLAALAACAPAAHARTFQYLGSFGSSGSNDGQFVDPWGVAIGANGTIFVSDRSRNRVTAFSYGGTLQGGFGSSGAGNGQFNAPSGLATDSSSGDVFVVDTGNSRVQRMTAGGGYVTQWGAAGGGNGQFSSPSGVATDLNWVYVADAGNLRVQKFGPSGAYVRQWANPDSAQFLTTDGARVHAATPLGSLRATSVFGDALADGGAPFSYGEVQRSGGLARDQRSPGLWWLEMAGNGPLAGVWALRRLADTGTVLEDVPLYGAASPATTVINGPGAIASDCRGTVVVVDRDGKRVERFGDPAAPPPPCSTPTSSLSATSLGFGQQAVSTVGPATAVELQAAGNGVDVSRISITGPNADDFLVSSDGCTGRTAWPGAPCTVKVRYAPNLVGPGSATLSITDATTQVTRDVSLTGTGVPAPAVVSGPPGPPGKDGKDGRDGRQATAATASCKIAKGRVSCVARPAGVKVSIVLVRGGKTFARGSGRGTVKLRVLRRLVKGTYGVRVSTATTSAGTALVIRRL